MKRTIVIILLVGMIGWAVYDFVISSNGRTMEEPENDIEVGLEIDHQAPDFELSTLEGETVKLSDFRGERVLVNFWATWCPPCRSEIPDLQKFHEETDIHILAINLTDTENDTDNIPKFAKNYGMEFSILMDEDLEVADIYQIQPIPSSFMIDSEGIIQYKAMGAMSYDLMIQEYEKMD